MFFTYIVMVLLFLYCVCCRFNIVLELFVSQTYISMMYLDYYVQRIGKVIH